MLLIVDVADFTVEVAATEEEVPFFLVPLLTSRCFLLKSYGSDWLIESGSKAVD